MARNKKFNSGERERLRVRVSESKSKSEREWERRMDKKQGWIHGNPVVDGWAGAVMQKPLRI